MTNSQRFVLILSTFLISFTLTPVLAQAQSDVAREKLLAKATNHPLVSLREAADRSRSRPIKPGPAREVPNFRSKGKPVFSGGTALSDAILQDTAGQQIAMVGSGFYGTSNNDNQYVVGYMIAPPDTDGQVGPDHFVQMINLLTTIFNKDGGIELEPFASNAFWEGIGGNCEAYNQGDPIILYDDVEDRWLVSQFAFPDSMTSYSQCVAVSMDGDPAGGWHRYEFSFAGYGLNDYPKHGIVSDSITMTANLFKPRGRNFYWAGTFLGVMDKAAMYAGQTASLIGFNIGTAEFGFVAGDLDGNGSVPALFATAMTTANRFDIWRIDVDWTTQAASYAHIASLPITPFDSELCSASRGACIPQPDGGPLLESLSDRLMHRLQIRQFPTHRSMVTAHTVDVGGGRAGIRWYELRESTGGNWALYQEGTYGPADGEYRFMPSAAMNAAGDIGIGYLLSSTGTYVSTAAVGQTFSASGSGVLDTEELICAGGSGVQENVSRAGDYSSTSIDPVDDSFWHTNEVFTETGSFQWNTFVCEFVVASNGANIPPVADFGYTCNELSCAFTDQSSDADGLIAAWSWAFGDGGTSSNQNPSHSFTADGSYAVTLLVTDNEGATDSATHTVSVSGPTVNLPPSASFSFDCSALACGFDGSASSDSDGSIASYQWDFGDDATASGLTTSHEYDTEGDYNVTLTVTDNLGATGSDSQVVTVKASDELDLIISAQMTSTSKWMARVEDLNGSNLQGSWSASGIAACSGSVCTLSNIQKKVLSVTFTAASTGETISIDKP
ncbi:MAG TPA: PKD domain-containing protein [Xanthomonadales bacterium]